MDNNQHQLFLKELMKIGLIKAETLQIYLDLFKRISIQSDIPFKLKHSQCLNEYFQSILEHNDFIKAISLAITNYCSQQIFKSRNNKLIRLIKIKEKHIKRITLRKWKKKDNARITSHRSDGSSNKISLNPSSRNRREDEELKECTFKPMVNNTSLSCFTKGMNKTARPLDERYSKNSSVYSRLYTDYIRMNLRKEMRKSESERAIGENTSFYPQTNSSSTRYKRNTSKSFNERQQSFNEHKSNNKDRISRYVESQYKKEHTFNPTTSKKSKIIISNKTKARSISASRHNRYMNESSPHIENKKEEPVRALDYKRIENLYLNYKEKGRNLMDLQRRTDEENGFTYQPAIANNHKAVILTKGLGKSIIERNEQFLKDKIEFIAKSNEEHFAYQNKQHCYTSQEKEQIAQNIIERLYDNSIEKVISRNCHHKDSTTDNSKTTIQKTFPHPFISNLKGNSSSQP